MHLFWSYSELQGLTKSPEDSVRAAANGCLWTVQELKNKNKRKSEIHKSGEFVAYRLLAKCNMQILINSLQEIDRVLVARRWVNDVAETHWIISAISRLGQIVVYLKLSSHFLCFCILGHIMISYSWSIQPQAKELKQVLQDNGYRVWMDIDNMG